MDFTIALFLKVILTNHHINGSGTTMMALGRMKRHYIIKFRQPFCQVAFQESNAIRISFAFAMQNDDRPQTIAKAILNETEHFPPGFVDRHPVQVKTCLDRIIAQAQFTKYTMLNTRSLPGQDVVSGQRLDRCGSQWIPVERWLIKGSALALQVSGCQFSWRLDIRLIRLSYPAHVLHLFKEPLPFVF